MTLPKSVKKRRQQLNARDVRGLVALCFYPLEEQKVNKSCLQSIFQVQTMFTPISRPEKHAELLKNYFEPQFKKLKFSTLVAKFDLRNNLTRELSLINICCWRADHEILIQFTTDGASRSELIFVSARQHTF